MITYVFCLVRSPRRPVLRDLPGGMPGGGPVRLLDAGGGLWAVAADVPEADYGAGALAGRLQDLDWVGRCALAHEAVVEHFLSAPALLPMQLFTLFTTDDRARAHLRRDRARLDRILARVERQVEWGLRLTLDEASARPPAAAPGGSGADYLARKRDQLGASRAQVARARAEAARFYRALAGAATEARRRTATERAAPGSRLLLDAALLVPARKAGTLRKTLRGQARALQSAGIVVSLTGPWPPYNFVAAGAPRRRVRAAAKHR